MDELDPVDAFTGLTRHDRARFLTHLAWELTVVAREYYVPGTEDLTDPGAVRAINELQHRVTAQARAALDEAARYPDDVLVRILLEEPPGGRPDLRRSVRRAFARAYSSVQAVASDH